MEELFYQMIFKRKSFHIFKGIKTLSEIELRDIAAVFGNLRPLVKDIRTAMRIVPIKETSCPRGEYALLFFSEKKGEYLQNIGYIGEQMDLWLAAHDIGACWYGFGKTEHTAHDGLDFIMMMAIEKVDPSEFRKDLFKSKRKPLPEVWSGDAYMDIAAIVRFAPSSCNTQPWKVISKNHVLTVYRYKQPGKRGMMPVTRVTFSNRIDIGILLLFIELCLTHEQLSFARKLYDDFDDDAELSMTAVYQIG